MKLHLPVGLRSSVLACLAMASGIVTSTLSTGTLVTGVAAVSFFASEQAAAVNVNVVTDAGWAWNTDGGGDSVTIKDGATLWIGNGTIGAEAKGSGVQPYSEILPNYTKVTVTGGGTFYLWAWDKTVDSPSGERPNVIPDFALNDGKIYIRDGSYDFGSIEVKGNSAFTTKWAKSLHIESLSGEGNLTLARENNDTGLSNIFIVDHDETKAVMSGTVTMQTSANETYSYLILDHEDSLGNAVLDMGQTGNAGSRFAAFNAENINLRSLVGIGKVLIITDALNDHVRGYAKAGLEAGTVTLSGATGTFSGTLQNHLTMVVDGVATGGYTLSAATVQDTLRVNAAGVVVDGGTTVAKLEANAAMTVNKATITTLTATAAMTLNQGSVVSGAFTANAGADGLLVNGAALNGAVTANAGIIVTGGAAISNTFTAAADGVSIGDSTLTGNVIINEGVTTALVGAVTLNSTKLTNNGVLDLSRLSLLTLSDKTSFTDNETIDLGELVVGGSGTVQLKGLTGRQQAAYANNVLTILNSSLDLIWAGTEDSHLWVEDGDTWKTADGSVSNFISGDSVTFGADAACKTVSIIGDLTVSSLTITGAYTFDVAEGSSLTLTSGGTTTLSGVALTKAGEGTLVLTRAAVSNAELASVNLQAGTLRISDEVSGAADYLSKIEGSGRLQVLINYQMGSAANFTLHENFTGTLELAHSGGNPDYAVVNAAMKMHQDAKLDLSYGKLYFVEDGTFANDLSFSGTSLISAASGKTGTISGNLSATGILSKVDSGTVIIANATGAAGSVEQLEINNGTLTIQSPLSATQVSLSSANGSLNIQSSFSATLVRNSVSNGVFNISGENTVVTFERYMGTAGGNRDNTQLNVTGGASLFVTGSTWETDNTDSLLITNWGNNSSITISGGFKDEPAEGGTTKQVMLKSSLSALNTGIGNKNGSGTINVENGGILNVKALGNYSSSEPDSASKLTVNLKEGGAIHVGEWGIGLGKNGTANRPLTLNITGGTIGILSSASSYKTHANVALALKGDLTINTTRYDALTGQYITLGGTITLNGPVTTTETITDGENTTTKEHTLKATGLGVLALGGNAGVKNVSVDSGATLRLLGANSIQATAENIGTVTMARNATLEVATGSASVGANVHLNSTWAGTLKLSSGSLKLVSESFADSVVSLTANRTLEARGGSLNSALTLNGGTLLFDSKADADGLSLGDHALTFGAGLTKLQLEQAPTAGSEMVLMSGVTGVSGGAWTSGGTNKLSSFFSGTSAYVNAQLVYNADAKTLSIVFGDVIAGEDWVWVGGAATEDLWDGTAANWTQRETDGTLVNPQPGAAPDSQRVYFTDTGLAATNKNEVVISGSVRPGAITVDAASYYIFRAATNGGSIDGTASLTKTGEGSLVMQLANSYSGGTVVENGRILMQAGGALGTGAVTVNGGSLEVYASGTIGSGAVAVNGGSVVVVAGAAPMGNTFTLSGYSAGEEGYVPAVLELNAALDNSNSIVFNGGRLDYKISTTSNVPLGNFSKTGSRAVAVDVAEGCEVIWETSANLPNSEDNLFSNGLTVSGGGTLTLWNKHISFMNTDNSIFRVEEGAHLVLVAGCEGNNQIIRGDVRGTGKFTVRGLAGYVWGVGDFSRFAGILELQSRNSSGGVNLDVDAIRFASDQLTGGADTTLRLDGASFMLLDASTIGAGKVEVADGTTNHMKADREYGTYTFVGDFSGGGTLAVDRNCTVNLTGTLSGFSGTLSTLASGKNVIFNLGGAGAAGVAYTTPEGSNKIFADGATLTNISGGYATYVLNYSNDLLEMNAAVDGTANLKYLGEGELRLTAGNTSAGTLTNGSGKVVITESSSWKGAVESSGTLRLEGRNDIVALSGGALETVGTAHKIGSIAGPLTALTNGTGTLSVGSAVSVQGDYSNAGTLELVTTGLNGAADTYHDLTLTTAEASAGTVVAGNVALAAGDNGFTKLTAHGNVTGTTGMMTLGAGSAIDGKLEAGALTVKGDGTTSIGSLKNASLASADLQGEVRVGSDVTVTGAFSNAGTLKMSADGNQPYRNLTLSQATAAGGCIYANNVTLAGGDNNLTMLDAVGDVKNGTGTLTLKETSSIGGSFEGGSLNAQGERTSIGSVVGTLNALTNAGAMYIMSDLSARSLTNEGTLELVTTGLNGAADTYHDLTLTSGAAKGGDVTANNASLAGNNSFGTLNLNGALTLNGTVKATNMKLGSSTVTLGSISSVASTPTIDITAELDISGPKELNFIVTAEALLRVGMRDGDTVTVLSAGSGLDNLDPAKLLLNGKADVYQTNTFGYSLTLEGTKVVLTAQYTGSEWTGKAPEGSETAKWRDDLEDWDGGAVPSTGVAANFLGDGASNVELTGDKTISGMVVDTTKTTGGTDAYTITGEGKLATGSIAILGGSLTLDATTESRSTVVGASVDPATQDSGLHVKEGTTFTTDSLTVYAAAVDNDAKRGFVNDSKTTVTGALIARDKNGDALTVTNNDELSIGAGSRVGTIAGDNSSTLTVTGADTQVGAVTGHTQVTVSGTGATAATQVEIDAITFANGTNSLMVNNSKLTVSDKVENVKTITALGGSQVEIASVATSSALAVQIGETTEGDTATDSSVTFGQAMTVKTLTSSGTLKLENANGVAQDLTLTGTTTKGGYVLADTLDLSQVGTGHSFSGLQVNGLTLDGSKLASAGSAGYLSLGGSGTAGQLLSNGEAAVTITLEGLADVAKLNALGVGETAVLWTLASGVETPSTYSLFSLAPQAAYRLDQALVDAAYDAGLKAQVRAENGTISLSLQAISGIVWNTADPDIDGTLVPTDGADMYSKETQEVFNGIGSINVNENLTLDLRDSDLPAGNDVGVKLNNVYGTDGKTITVLGNGIGDDLVTLTNSVDTDVAANEATTSLKVEDATLQIGAPSADGVVESLAVRKVELEGAALKVNDASTGFAAGALVGDAASELSGTISVRNDGQFASGSEPAFKGSYGDSGATVNMEAGRQLLTPGATLAVRGTGGTAILDYGPFDAPRTMRSIRTQGASVTLNNTDGDDEVRVLRLTESSRMEGGTLSFGVGVSDVHKGNALPILDGTDVDLIGTKVVAKQKGELGDNITFDISQGTKNRELFTLGYHVTAADVEVLLEGDYFTSYYRGAHMLENGTVVADLIDDRYSSMFDASGNTAVGLKMLDMAYLESNPLANDPYGDLAGVLKAMDGFAAAGDSAAADKLGAAVAGSGVASLGMALSGDVERQLKAIRNRTTTMGVGQAVVNHNLPYYNAWINAEGDHSEMDADGLLAGYEMDSRGGTVGFDMDLTQELTAGLAVTAMYGDFTSDAADMVEGELETQYISAFGRISHKAWVHTFVATIGMHSSSMERTVNYAGDCYKTQGDADGMSYGFLYEVARTYALNENASACWQPVLNLSYRHTGVDGYSEMGSDAALTFGEQSLDVLTLGIGARMQAVVGESVYNRSSIFEARALAKFDSGDTESELETGLLRSAAAPGTIRSAERDAFGVELGAGLTVPMGLKSGAFFIDASVEFRGSYTNMNGTLGYRFNF